MSIDKHRFKIMLRRAADLWLENSSVLCDIDSKFGDGDHGVTIGKIAKLFHLRAEAWGDENFRDFIEALGDGIMGISGGSAGPLYGTLVGGLAGPLGGEAVIDGAILKQMLTTSLAAMREITRAGPDDKTMMDALIPAVEAARTANDDPAEVLKAAALAAAAGAESTKDKISKFGRARSYGDKTLGTPDAGAVSTALFLRGLHEGFVRPQVNNITPRDDS